MSGPGEESTGASSQAPSRPSPPDGPAIELSGLGVRVAGQVLLDAADLTVAPGEVVLLAGASGSGKSTLLRVLTGLSRDDPIVETSGSVRVSGRQIIGSSSDHSDGDHVPIGIVFQDCALFDDLDVAGNLDFALEHRSDARRRADLRDRLTRFVSAQGIEGSRAVRSLSGGQRQRVAIARTLAFDPAIIVFDEPTTGLDPASRRRVMDLILETRREFGLTALIVSHDVALAESVDRVVVLENRALVERESGAELSQVLADDQTGTLEPPVAGASAAGHPLSARLVAAPLLGGVGMMGAVGWALEATGAALAALLAPALALTPLDGLVGGADSSLRSTPRFALLSRWWWRYLGHYLRLLLVGSAIPYIMIAGAIAGFVATHFTFTFLPSPHLTEPLIIDDVLPGLGFALYRIIVPVAATLLLAARNGAAIASDVGNRSYGRQLLAMRSLGASPRAYLLGPSFVASLVATLVLTLVCFYVAELTSMLVLGFTRPELSPDYWAAKFAARLGPLGLWGLGTGLGFVVAKALLCGAGVAAVAYACGREEMSEAAAVSRATTRAIILATTLVLLVHFVLVLLEFEPPPPRMLPWAQ